MREVIQKRESVTEGKKRRKEQETGVWDMGCLRLAYLGACHLIVSLGNLKTAAFTPRSGVKLKPGRRKLQVIVWGPLDLSTADGMRTTTLDITRLISE